MLLDIGRRLPQSDTLPGALSIAIKPGLLSEPNGVVADRSALVQVEQHLRDPGLLRGRVSAGVAEGNDGPLRLGKKCVLGGFRTVAAGDLAERLATFFEKPMRVLGEERLLCAWNGKRVPAEHELTP